MTFSAFGGLELRSGTTDTAISGYAGTKTARKGLASDTHVVSHLSAGERWDAPCELDVYKADINFKEDSLVSRGINAQQSVQIRPLAG